jgi:hypothetical protein
MFIELSNICISFNTASKKISANCYIFIALSIYGLRDTFLRRKEKKILETVNAHAQNGRTFHHRPDMIWSYGRRFLELSLCNFKERHSEWYHAFYSYITYDVIGWLQWSTVKCRMSCFICISHYKTTRYTTVFVKSCSADGAKDISIDWRTTAPSSAFLRIICIWRGPGVTLPFLYTCEGISAELLLVNNWRSLLFTKFLYYN